MKYRIHVRGIDDMLAALDMVKTDKTLKKTEPITMVTDSGIEITGTKPQWKQWVENGEARTFHHWILTRWKS